MTTCEKTIEDVFYDLKTKLKTLTYALQGLDETHLEFLASYSWNLEQDLSAVMDLVTERFIRPAWIEPIFVEVKKAVLKGKSGIEIADSYGWGNEVQPSRSVRIAWIENFKTSWLEDMP